MCLPSLPASFIILSKEKEKILLLYLKTKYHSREGARGEGFGHVAHSQVRVPQYAPLGMSRLYFKQRSKICSFHFQRAWTGLWGALKSRGSESLHSCSPMHGEDRSGCGCVCPPAVATQLLLGAQCMRSTQCKRAQS